MASGKLTARKVETAKPGRHGDGAGLWLIVSPSGARRWALRFNWQGKPTEAGLGSFPEVGLAEARDKALEARKLVKSGVNPIAEKKRQEGHHTLQSVADEFYKEHSPAWKSEVYKRWWRVSLQTHAARIMEKPIDEVTSDDLSEVLQPIWLSKPQTASLLRARLEKMFDFAKARRYREGENPALKRGGGVAHLLPKQGRREARNHPAMPFAQVPDFVRKLRATSTPWARPLILQILTAVRPSEALGARWEEFDFSARIWRIPGPRMKAGKAHEVPLSSAAITLLEELRASSRLLKKPAALGYLAPL
jgi:integrase